MPDSRPSDRTALGLLGLLAAIFANALLLTQLFVLRPVFEAKLDAIIARIARIEGALGLKPVAASSVSDSVWVRF